MKILAVFALLCAVLALTTAAPAPEEEPQEAPKASPEEEPQEAPKAAPEEEPEEAPEGVEVEEAEDAEAQAEELDVEKRTFCTYGWTRIGHRVFFYVSQHLTWAQAEKNCVSLGGHLASVHSQWEYKQIQALIRRQTKGNPATWLGGSDCRQEGVWRWTDGTRFNFRKWCCGEPNNGQGRNQDCLQMNYSGHKCWDDLQCNNRRPSVCVRKH